MTFKEFKKKIFNVKTLLITIFPLFALSINSYLRYSHGYYYLDGMGYSMSAMAIGAIVPFSIFEYILIGKVLEFKPIYEITNNRVTITYNLNVISPKNDTITDYIEKVKLATYALCVVCTILFILSIILDSTGFESWALLVGAINGSIVWLYLVFV